MHWTVGRTFETFISRYISSEKKFDVLEIGSQNFNGGLRDFKKHNMNWIGVDLSDGPGVDKVVGVGESLPFDSGQFDLVLASSVFEHDIQFWNTFLEMVRVVKDTGIVLLIMPSQGSFHRYPLDAFRFYPDSGTALARWSNQSMRPIELIESFTTRPENDVWADYVAIFGRSPDKYQSALLGEVLKGENWVVGNELIESTYQELPFELRKIIELEEANVQLNIDVQILGEKLRAVQASKSWKFTQPARNLLSKILQITKI
jgi:SAM-dependent methyltransferase